jgi:hypothetical protein
MTMDYAKAYSNEAIAYACMKRRQREAVLGYKATKNAAGRPIRTAIGEQLINIGEHLSKTPSPAPSAVTNMARS